MRFKACLLSLALPLCAMEDDREVMHAAMGMVAPVAQSNARMELAWSLSIGNTYWPGNFFGIRLNLDYHNFGLSHSLLRTVGAKDGLGEIFSFRFSGVWVLHRSETSALYFTSGIGGYQRQISLEEPGNQALLENDAWLDLEKGQIPPEIIKTNRPGLHIGLGWECPMGRGTTLFIEAEYHRVFTHGITMDFVPVMVGTRF